MNKIVYYDSEKISMVLNILNQVSWRGLEQVQAIAQISVILGNPSNVNEENKNNDKNNKLKSPNKEVGDK